MPPAARIASARQRRLFDALEECGELVLAIGPEGLSANLVGVHRIRRHGLEDVLDIDDGKCHVHVDWRRLKRAEIGIKDGEGVLVFYDRVDALFRLYRPSGAFSVAVARAVDSALWPPPVPVEGKP